MSISRWAEISCDTCGQAEHFILGHVKALAREYGWIITAKGKHYCSKECYQKSRNGNHQPIQRATQ